LCCHVSAFCCTRDVSFYVRLCLMRVQPLTPGRETSTLPRKACVPVPYRNAIAWLTSLLRRICFANTDCAFTRRLEQKYLRLESRVRALESTVSVQQMVRVAFIA
jgi:hypothetical protein